MLFAYIMSKRHTKIKLFSLAQSVEHEAVNLDAVGSSPTGE